MLIKGDQKNVKCSHLKYSTKQYINDQIPSNQSIRSQEHMELDNLDKLTTVTFGPVLFYVFKEQNRIFK